MNYKNSNKRIYSNSLHSDINFFFSFHCQINILRILLQNNYNNSYGMKWLLVLNKMCGLVGVMTKATNRFFFIGRIRLFILVSTDNPCYNNPCLNGGQCNPSIVSNAAVFTCTCVDNWAGTLCDTGKYYWRWRNYKDCVLQLPIYIFK